MAIYENMPPDGHLNFAERIFTKIKNLFDTKVQTDVPANAVFTDEKVTQTESTTDENYEILMSGTASTATLTEGANKSSGFKYNPNKHSVMEGQDSKALGQRSHAEGYYTSASGYNSHSEGQGTLASGINSHSEGYYSKATGSGSHAEGNFSYAKGDNSHAEGYYTYTNGSKSHAEGNNTTAKGDSSHSEGYKTLASGSNSHAEGSETTSSGSESHSEGIYSNASGNNSHAEGYCNIANGDATHIEGYQNFTTTATSSGHAEGYHTTISSCPGNHSEGYYTYAYGSGGAHAEGGNTRAGSGYSHAEGYGTYVTPAGNAGHAEGVYTTAVYVAHAEGESTYARGDDSHAEGYHTYTGGSNSHAEGYYTSAQGYTSHAEGYHSYAQGYTSHAEGYKTTASGDRAHAEGNNTLAQGSYSHVQGQYTTASHRSQHIFGEYNIIDNSENASTTRGNYVEIVGNGLSSTQLSNARTLDWDGNEWVAAGVSVDGLSSTTEGETSTTVQTSSAHLQNKSLTLSDTTDTITPSETEGEDPTIETETHVIEVTPEDILLDDTWDGSRTSLKEAVTFLGSQSAANKVSKSGDTMTGDLSWNGETGFQSGLYWKEYNFGDKFKIYPHFSGSNDSNYLTIATATGDEGTDPELIETFKFYPSGKFETAGSSIDYKGTQATYPMIKFIDNTADAYGNGISIGGGGTTIIGGGESSDAMASSLSGGGSELMYIGNDGDVHIHTNLQNGWNSRKTFTFSAGGRLTIPEYCYASYFNQSSGAETPSTGSYFIYCNSDGFFRKSTRLNAAKALTNQNVSSPGYVVSLTDNWGTFGYSTIAQLKAKFGYGTIVTKNAGDYIATTGGNLTGKLTYASKMSWYLSGNTTVLGVTDGCTVRSYSNINIYKPMTASAFTVNSSRLVKENVKDITENEANKILELRVVDFDYIEAVGGKKNQTGLIAEEVLDIFPSCVDIPNNYDEEDVKRAIEDGDMINPLSIDYSKLVAPLIKLVQMQQKEIDDLKAAIKTS